jgi:hypothetical protein
MKDAVNLLYNIASGLPAECSGNRSTLVTYVATNKVNKNNFPYAVAYLKKIGSDPLNIAEFEKECGIGK